MVTNRNNKQIPLSDIERGIEAGVSGADPLRIAGLENLNRVRRTKAKSQQRQYARLSRRLGADHPRVLALSKKMEANQTLIRNLDLERDRAQTDIPTRDSQAWILYGFVRDRTLKGLPNLTVALYDKEKKWIESLGFACTNLKGSFQLVATPSPDILKSMQVFIHVLDQQRKPLYMGQQALTPALGQVDYCEITISGESIVCPPPEESIDRRPGIPLDGSVLWFQQNTNELRQDDKIDSVVLFQLALRRIQEHLQEFGDKAQIVVKGYSSTEGDETLNRQLSQRRADLVRTRLLNENIVPAEQIVVRALGEDATFSTLALNRRVEIELSTIDDSVESVQA